MVGETRAGGANEPPRYVATYRDANGQTHVQPLTGRFLSTAEKAYNRADSRAQTVEQMN